jgi:hypothetical protein
MPSVGSILIVGGSRSTQPFPCARCHKPTTWAETIKCALYGCQREHSLCPACIRAIQRFACADPDAADARLKVTADRATPKEQP